MNFNDEHNFTFHFQSSDGKKRVEINFDESYLSDILNSFRDFLQACGYEIDGHLEVMPFDDFEYGKAIQSGQQKISEQPEFSFDNLPNNGWPFGELKPTPISSLTTADIAAIKPIDLSGLTVTDLSTMNTKSWNDWTKPNQYPTMAPLTTEQVYSWSADLPTQNGEKIRVQF